MYPIVNIDRMHGTDNHADLRSVKFGSFSGNVFTGAAINNGCVVVLSGAIDFENYYAVAPTSTNKFQELWLIASPEYLPNPLEQSLDCFRNESGALSRAYSLRDGDCFSITEDGVDGGSSASVGAVIYAQNGDVKLKAGSGAIQVGTVSRKETRGGKNWLVIDVLEALS